MDIKMLWLSLFLAAPVAANAQSSFVVVVVDDMAVEDLQYPTGLSELAAQGIRFDGFIAANPICGPSRASLLRGQHDHNTRVTHNQSPDGGFERFLSEGHESDNLGTRIHDAGIPTLFAGKYLNGYGSRSSAIPLTHTPPGWTEWHAGPRLSDGYEYDMNDNGVVHTYVAEHSNDRIFAITDSFIRAHATQQFFAIVSFGSPHGPSVSALRHRGIFDSLPLPQRANFNEADRTDKPAWVQAKTPMPATDQGRPDRFHDRLETLVSVAEAIAGIRNTLDELNRSSDTYILFVSDNGWHYGEHAIPASKGTQYEESMRVPAWMIGPGIAPGVRGHLLTMHDIAPTVLSAMGIAVPSYMDGKSFMPVVSSTPISEGAWRKQILTSHNQGPKGGGPSPSFTGLRGNNKKCSEYITGETELYFLNIDPYETINRSDKPSDLAICLNHMDLMTNCAGETCRSLELTSIWSAK